MANLADFSRQPALLTLTHFDASSGSSFMVAIFGLVGKSEVPVADRIDAKSDSGEEEVRECHRGTIVALLLPYLLLMGYGAPAARLKAAGGRVPLQKPTKGSNSMGFLPGAASPFVEADFCRIPDAQHAI